MERDRGRIDSITEFIEKFLAMNPAWPTICHSNNDRTLSAEN